MTRTIPEVELSLAERTADYIRDRVDAERHKGGYITPCDDWVAPDEVSKHAERCVICQSRVAEEVGDA